MTEPPASTTAAAAAAAVPLHLLEEVRTRQDVDVETLTSVCEGWAVACVCRSEKPLAGFPRTGGSKKALAALMLAHVCSHCRQS
jgi:cobalamin biosynthesis protein CbiD